MGILLLLPVLLEVDVDIVGPKVAVFRHRLQSGFQVFQLHPAFLPIQNCCRGQATHTGIRRQQSIRTTGPLSGRQARSSTLTYLGIRL